MTKHSNPSIGAEPSPHSPDRPAFAVGQEVLITGVGCDCDGTSYSAGWCYRHDLVGLTAVVESVDNEDGVTRFSLDIDNEDVWYEDELRAAS